MIIQHFISYTYLGNSIKVVIFTSNFHDINHFIINVNELNKAHYLFIKKMHASLA